MQHYKHNGQQVTGLISHKRINPVFLSEPEARFLGEHVGESPGRALKGEVPEGVKPTTMRPLLQYFFDVIESGDPTWCGAEEFRERLEPWLTRMDKIRDTQPFNNGANFDIELYAKQGSKYVRGGVGSDFAVIQRYAFNFLDDEIPGTLEDALLGVAEPARERLEKQVAEDRRREAVMEAAVAEGALTSDGHGRLFREDEDKGHIYCIASDCGWMTEYNPKGQRSERVGALRKLYLHAGGKYRANDEDHDHGRIAFGLKESS